MTYQELQDIFQVPWLLPWEHDYYIAKYENEITKQEFLDSAYEKIENLSGIWYEVNGSTVYFIVKKGIVIPEDFAVTVDAITDVPEQPAPEEGTV